MAKAVRLIVEVFLIMRVRAKPFERVILPFQYYNTSSDVCKQNCPIAFGTTNCIQGNPSFGA